MELKTFSFSQILMPKIWAKRRVFSCRKGKIVSLNEERYLERQISKKQKFSKTAIYQATARFRNFRSFLDLYRSGRSRIISQKNDHLMKRMVVRSPTSSSKNTRIKSALLLKGTVVSKTILKRRLIDELGL